MRSITNDDGGKSGHNRLPSVCFAGMNQSCMTCLHVIMTFMQDFFCGVRRTRSFAECSPAGRKPRGTACGGGSGAGSRRPRVGWNESVILLWPAEKKCYEISMLEIRRTPFHGAAVGFSFPAAHRNPTPAGVPGVPGRTCSESSTRSAENCARLHPQAEDSSWKKDISP